MFKPLLFSLFITSLSLLPTISWAQSLIYTRGLVQINSEEASKGHALKQGDTIKTGENSLAILDLGSGSKLKIEAQSEVRYKNVIQESSGSFLQLVRGKIIARARKQSDQKEHFKVFTPTAAFGVRGTEFFVAIDESQDKGLETWMCVLEGVVSARGADKKEKIVRSGEGVRVNSTGVSDPRFLPWTKKLNWELDNFEDINPNDSVLSEAYQDPLKLDYD